MALVMVMTMAQCKKNNPTAPDNHNNVVTITLDVKNNNGSRVDVNTTTGTVNFETGDKVYVGSGGKYVGFLTHNGTNFVGNITNPTENQPLQFYFLGNVMPTETLSAGTTEECSVIISDQTEHLPVISCAASFENYVSGVTSYTSHLLNKCALVKFNVTTPSNSPICITGMKNKVTVDFSQNTVTPSIDGDGVIMLPAGSGENVEKWAILLPQEALEEGEEGSAYSEDGNYTGVRSTIPIISENDYLGDELLIGINYFKIQGAINGLFSVSPTQKVYFSQGNLQYQASTCLWQFAENQWDFVGENNTNISETYNDWIDLFCWGTSGYNHGASCYQPWSTSLNNADYYAYGSYTYDLYDQNGQADWGYNSVINGGNNVNQWRTLSTQEWEYVFSTRNTSSNVRFAKANIEGVKGIILLPDDWDASICALNMINNETSGFSSNNISISEFKYVLQARGAVFFPASLWRWGTTVENYPCGYYWSASHSNIGANCVYFCDDDLVPVYENNGRENGFAVRLVQDYNP